MWFDKVVTVFARLCNVADARTIVWSCIAVFFLLLIIMTTGTITTTIRRLSFGFGEYIRYEI